MSVRGNEDSSNLPTHQRQQPDGQEDSKQLPVASKQAANQGKQSTNQSGRLVNGSISGGRGSRVISNSNHVSICVILVLIFS